MGGWGETAAKTKPSNSSLKHSKTGKSGSGTADSDWGESWGWDTADHRTAKTD